jgi:Kef-type K+ transport system membrane component KefB
MAEESFRGLAIIAAVAFFVPLLLGFLPRLRLPSAVLEIACGVVLGPAVLGWVTVDAPVRIMSRIGLAALLALSGLEIDFENIRGRLLKIGLGNFLVSAVLALVVSFLFQLAGLVRDPLLVAIILASTAAGVVTPILKDAGQAATNFGQIVIVGSSIAQFGAIILLALLFTSQGGGAGETIFLLGCVAILCAIVALAGTRLGRWQRLTDTMARLQETTAMIRVRGATFLLLALVSLVEKLGLEVILGAFAAGMLLGFIDRDVARTHPQFHMRLQAVGFGVFIPVFFVTSGLQFNLRALTGGGMALAAVPLFLLALYVVRGVPALLYRNQVGARKALAGGLLQATSLPFIVAAVRIGEQLGKLQDGTGAVLISAGMLSVLIFPACALTLLKAKETQQGSS